MSSAAGTRIPSSLLRVQWIELKPHHYPTYSANCADEMTKTACLDSSRQALHIKCMQKPIRVSVVYSWAILPSSHLTEAFITLSLCRKTKGLREVGTVVFLNAKHSILGIISKTSCKYHLLPRSDTANPPSPKGLMMYSAVLTSPFAYKLTASRLKVSHPA